MGQASAAREGQRETGVELGWAVTQSGIFALLWVASPPSPLQTQQMKQKQKVQRKLTSRRCLPKDDVTSAAEKGFAEKS